MKGPRELARSEEPDREHERAIRDALRMDPEALEALRRMCVSPGRNAMAQIAALRLRMEYTLPRPAQESRLTLDATGPLTVRFDLSGMPAPALDVTPPRKGQALPPKRDGQATPPGGRPGGGRAAAATSPSTEELPLPNVSPTLPYTD
jgi:hypothetical protein